MYNVGVFPMKGLPPHRGHLHAIINSATRCKKLYVVVSHNEQETVKLCNEANCTYISLQNRVKWLSVELQGFTHIKVLGLDESDIPVFPNGWSQWAMLLRNAVPEPFDVIFGGEESYIEGHAKNFPNVVYELFDYKRERYGISGTDIRNNPLKHWEYILGSARPFFAKKVLIAGTESAGKSTLTKYLAKIFYTAWSEEFGRYYSDMYLGGNETIFTTKDFENICFKQYEQDMNALNKANKVVFFDTDAVITEYYANLYIGNTSDIIKSFIDPTRYDLVLFMRPDVTWVDDGKRFMGEEKKRWELHKILLNMYIQYGFKNIIEIGGDYNERLHKAVEIIDSLLEGK